MLRQTVSVCILCRDASTKGVPMIHQIIVFRLGIRRRRKVHPVTPTCLLHLIVRPRQAEHPRVKVPDVRGHLGQGVACRVARDEDGLDDGFTEEFVCTSVANGDDR